MNPAFAERVRGGDVLVGTFVSLGSPTAAALCARAGFDWLLLDTEHGDRGEDALLAQILAAPPAAAVVRVETGARIRVGRALDLGADAIMAPRVDGAAEAAAFARALRYPPDGERGVSRYTWGGGLGARSYAQLQDVNRAIVGIAQIESPSAVADADAIARLPGIDVLFVGPTDLSFALGIPGQTAHPDFQAAISQVAAAAAAHGKAAGMLLRDPADIPAWVGRGYRVLALGSDAAWIDAGARRMVADARSALACEPGAEDEEPA